MLFRLNPAMPTQAYDTYRLVAPVNTHYRDATCVEVDCPNYINGWKTVVDTSSVLGARQAQYIRMQSGRSFTVMESGPMVTFTFPAGQRCFSGHKVPLEREPLYVVRGGDWRAVTRSPRRVDASEWRDRFEENQGVLHDAIEKG